MGIMGIMGVEERDYSSRQNEAEIATHTQQFGSIPANNGPSPRSIRKIVVVDPECRTWPRCLWPRGNFKLGLCLLRS